jgi:hypothetical protein
MHRLDIVSRIVVTTPREEAKTTKTQERKWTYQTQTECPREEEARQHRLNE